MNQQQEPSVCIHPQQSQLLLPLYRVILHNDDFNGMHFVISVLMRVFKFSQPIASGKMLEAHNHGSVCCVTEPFETAEHHRDQLRSCGLTSTIEPAA